MGSGTGNDLLGSKVSKAESGSQSKTDEGQSCHWRGIRQAPRCSFHCLSRHTTKRSAEPVINDVSSAGALALWLSGLRLGEALGLTWDQWADGIRVDVSGKFVKLLIPAEAEKGGRDRIYPVTPDFAEFLLAVPEDQRTGYVFNVVLGKGVSRRVDSVSSKIIDIGKAAGIKVDERRQGKESIPVWASAHDLRRAFGTRWSQKVTAMILKELMRHASVTTTETYYVDSDADATAAMLAAITGNTANEVPLEVPRKN